MVVRVNRVTKTELVSRNGQTFEKAVVEEILTDNLQADGSRVGQQTVTVKMLTGVRKGETLEVTSSSGYLLERLYAWNACDRDAERGRRDDNRQRVYTGPEWVIYIFAALYLLLLCVIGGKQGVRGSLGLVFTFISVIFLYIPLIYQGYSPFWTAVFVCFVTTLVTMYLIGGTAWKDNLCHRRYDRRNPLCRCHGAHFQ